VSDDWASLKRVDRFSAGLSLRDILLILVVRGVEKTRDAKKGQADRSESRFFAGWDGMGCSYPVLEVDVRCGSIAGIGDRRR
jgi:hypothetical protein